MFKPSHYKDTSDFLEHQLNGFSPEVLLVLGSGLGFMAEKLEIPMFIPYADIPNFKTSTAPGHKGRLVAGVLSGKKILAMQGRFHVYEGYSPEDAAFPIRVASMLGADTMIVTCACGGVNTSFKPGDLAILTDIINLNQKGALAGFDIEDFDTRFVDMSHAFDVSLIKLAKKAAKRKKIQLQEGVYFYMPGPNFETPAEVKAIRILGGDLVGMSTVHEVAMAARTGMKTLGIGLVSNMAAGILSQPITEHEVLVEAEKSSAVFSELITDIIGSI